MEMDGGISAEAGPILLTAPSSAADTNSGQTRAAEGRLASLDFFRGLMMFLLIGEATGLYELLRSPAFHGTLVGGIGWQLEHHPWNGLHCWDLVQPFFMFIVGVAMPFSIGKRWQRGDSWQKTFHHALIRSSLLLFFGWALYCIGPGRLSVPKTRLRLKSLILSTAIVKVSPPCLLHFFSYCSASSLGFELEQRCRWRTWPSAISL